MGLSEMQESAARHQALLDERERARASEEAVEPEKDLAAKLHAVEHTLAVFDVQGALEAIRDAYWKEGEIRPIEQTDFDGAPKRGSALVSDSFPSLIWGDGVMRAGKIASISVTAEWKESKKTGKGVVVSVRETPVSGVEHQTELSAYERYLRAGGDAEKVMRQIQGGSTHREGNFFASLEGEVDKFNYFLLKNAETRVRTGNLPRQIRERSERVIAEFPAVLREKGRATQRQLRSSKWPKPSAPVSAAK